MRNPTSKEGRWERRRRSTGGPDEVPADLAAALEKDPKAKAAFDALKGSERYSVLYRPHQVQGAEKRRAAVEHTTQSLQSEPLSRFVTT